MDATLKPMGRSQLIEAALTNHHVLANWNLKSLRNPIDIDLYEESFRTP